MFKSYGLIGRKALFSALLALGLLLLAGKPVQAELPRLPQLALVPPSFSSPLAYGNNTFYPDGRIWAVRSPRVGPKREILVPVLIKNTWITDPQLSLYEAKPIHSFDFKIQYDGTALRAVGVQKMGPLSSDTFSLAKDFNLQWEVANDVDYKKSLDPSQGDNPDGRRIRITGTSAHPLPPSPPYNEPTLDRREFVELLYVRFEVLITTDQAFPSNIPLIITNDTLMYNDMDVKEMQFQDEVPPAPNEQVPGRFAGLAGINNENLPPSVIEPTVEGVVYVNFADPGRFEFDPAAEVRPVPNTEGEWELIKPLTIEKFENDPSVAKIVINAFDAIPFTRISNIRVRSDASWLQFGALNKDGCPGPTSDCEIEYMDNGILGGLDPLGAATVPDEKVRLEIIADPNATGSGDPYYDGAGLYIGYITFYSETAEITPVRLKVTFIVYRNPIEPLDPSDFENQNEFNFGTGIDLTVENSRTPADRTNLIFGTGVGASDGVDALFAEAEYDDAIGNTFGARFINADAPNGLRDLTGRSASRDVRSVDSKTAHVYCVEFNTGSEQDYPVIFTLDTKTIPTGARLFVRDGENIIDLNDLTPVVGNPDLRTYTVTDARIKRICFEYAPPSVMDFPLVQKGWNLVSLPVRPGDREYREVFPNALEAPRFFSANDYFQEPNGLMRFGIGYFVKYGNILDTKLAGVPVYEIGVNTPYRILLREGWNTIGALSCPVPVEEIKFDVYNGQALPRLTSNVYRYRTDRGYEQVSVLEPGVGYWVKIEGDGYLNMKTDPARCGEGKVGASFGNAGVGSKLVIRDKALREGAVFVAPNAQVDAARFALPPVPPVGLFDVRFTSGRFVETATEPVVEFSGVEYPVVLEMNNAEYNYTVVDALTGAVLGTIEQGNGGSIEINNPKTFAVKLLKSGLTGADYSLEQNIPNPAGNSTAINFTLPQSEKVSIKLYDVMGREVATIFEGVASAGVNVTSFNTSALQSGTYTYTISAGSFTATRRMVVVK